MSKSIVWYSRIGTPPFCSEARRAAGGLLRRLQDGETLTMPVSRPMPTIGAGCHELRLRDRRHNWRIVYFIDRDAIVVLEVFAKKTAATPARTIERCRGRLRSYRGARA